MSIQSKSLAKFLLFESVIVVLFSLIFLTFGFDTELYLSNNSPIFLAFELLTQYLLTAAAFIFSTVQYFLISALYCHSVNHFL